MANIYFFNPIFTKYNIKGLKYQTIVGKRTMVHLVFAPPFYIEDN